MKLGKLLRAAAIMALLGSVLCGGTLAATPTSAIEGDGWAYNGNGLLTITTNSGMTAWRGASGPRFAEVTSLSIGDAVTAIAKSAFDDCTGLTNVTFPENVSVVGLRAFEGCSNLTSVTFKGAVVITSHAFHDCPRLSEITFSQTDAPAFRREENFGYYYCAGTRGHGKLKFRIPATANVQKWIDEFNLHYSGSDGKFTSADFITYGANGEIVPPERAGFKGEALVIITPHDVRGGAIEKHKAQLVAKQVASAVGGDTYAYDVYTGLSKAGGRVSAHFRSGELTTEELISRLKNPDLPTVHKVLAISDNHEMAYDAAFSYNDVHYNSDSIMEARTGFSGDPNDHFYNSLWGLRVIGAPEAWKITTGNDNLYAVVLDTGVMAKHPDLNVVSGYNAYDNNTKTDDSRGHGTHVAGILGAIGNNNVSSSWISEKERRGLVGVSWGTKIIPLRAGIPTSGDIVPNRSTLTKGLTYVTDLLLNGTKIAVLNISQNYWLPIRTATNGYIEPSSNSQMHLFRTFRDFADINNVPVVTISAGNASRQLGAPAITADPDLERNVVPGNYDTSSFISISGAENVIHVGAVEQNSFGDIVAAEYSNWSDSMVDIVAPGSGIRSTYINDFFQIIGQNNWADLSGTSMAAPHVAGAAVLVRSVFEDMGVSGVRARDIKDIILSNTDPNINPVNLGAKDTVNGRGREDLSGHTPDTARLSRCGLLRVDRAVNAARNAAIKTNIRLMKNNVRVGDTVVAALEISPAGALRNMTVAGISWDFGTDPNIEFTEVQGPLAPWINDPIVISVKAKAPGTYNFSCNITYRLNGTTFNSIGEASLRVVPNMPNIPVRPRSVTAMEAGDMDWNEDGHWQDAERLIDRFETFDRHHLSDWQGNTAQHVRNCSECGYSQSEQHKWVLITDDEVHKNICSVCGYSNGTPSAHYWNYQWSGNAAAHWHDCTTAGCKERNDYAEHMDANGDEVCDICNASTVHTVHTPKTDDSGKLIWKSDDTLHWNICTEGDEALNTDPHSERNEYESDAESHWKVCAICSMAFDKAEHKFGSWSSDEYEHWRTCSVCKDELVLAGSHVDTDGDAKCDTCGYTIYVVTGMYRLEFGDGQSFEKGYEPDLLYMTTIPYDEFKGVIIDGTQIANASYELDGSFGTGSSTIVRAAYLKGMLVGKHDISFVGKSGAVMTTFTVTNADDVIPTPTPSVSPSPMPSAVPNPSTTPSPIPSSAPRPTPMPSNIPPYRPSNGNGGGCSNSFGAMALLALAVCAARKR